MLSITARTISYNLTRSTRILARSFTAEVSQAQAVSKEESNKPKGKGLEATPLSSCQENTILNGLNYLKDQPPVLALKDEEYPSWLWGLLKPKVYPDDGPGGRGEKMRLRAANRQRIKEQNFLKTQ